MVWSDINSDLEQTDGTREMAVARERKNLAGEGNMTNCEIPWTNNSLNVKSGRCLRGRIIHWLPFTSEMTHLGLSVSSDSKKKTQGIGEARSQMGWRGNLGTVKSR